MFKAENIQLFSSNLDDQAVMPISEDNSVVESPSADINRVRLPLDLNRELIKSPASTFFARLRDGSTESNGDLLIIDKSIEPYDGCLVVASVDGEFILKRIKIEDDTTWLISAREESRPIKVELADDYIVWGVVKYLIKKM